MRIVGLVQKPEVVKRILDHLQLSSSEPPGRSPPSPTTSKEPTREPLFDDLPWEEPTFAAGEEPTCEADRPPDDEPIGGAR